MAEHITVVTESRNLRSTQFIPDGDQIMIGKQWEEWLEGIEREFRFFRIGDPADKKDALIIYGGKEIARLEKSLPDPENREDRVLNCYEKLREKLNEYFAPKKNKHYARYVFLKMRPMKDESTTAYATRLREKVHDCEFPDEDDRILEHIIQTTDNQSLIRKTINKKWSLSEMLQEVHKLEDTRLQVTDMTEKYQHREIARVNRDRKNRRGYSPSDESDYEVQRQNCKFCNYVHSFRRREDCPAYGRRCDDCHGWNHFASVCKKGNKNKNRKVYRNSRDDRRHRNSNREVRAVDVDRNIDHESEESFSDSESDSDGEFFMKAVHHIRNVRETSKREISANKMTVPVMLDDVLVNVELDSGADANVMDENQYRAYKCNTYRESKLRKSKVTLSTLQSNLQVMGEFTTTVRNQTRGMKTKFIVVKGQINSPPLLGKRTLEELGMMKINVDGSFKEQNELRIRNDNGRRNDFELRIKNDNGRRNDFGNGENSDDRTDSDHGNKQRQMSNRRNKEGLQKRNNRRSRGYEAELDNMVDGSSMATKGFAAGRDWCLKLTEKHENYSRRDKGSWRRRLLGEEKKMNYQVQSRRRSTGEGRRPIK